MGRVNELPKLSSNRIRYLRKKGSGLGTGVSRQDFNGRLFELLLSQVKPLVIVPVPQFGLIYTSKVELV